MSLAKKSGSVFCTRVFLFVLGFASSIVVTRALGPTNRGVLEIVNTLPFLLANIGHFGIGNANLYFAGKGIYSFEKIFSNALGFVFLIGTILIAIALGFYGLFKSSLYAGIPQGLIIVSFLLLPLLLFEKYVLYALLGRDKIYLRNKIIIIKGVLNFIIVITLVIIYKMEVLGVVLALISSNVLSNFIIFYAVKKEVRLSIKCDFDMLKKSIKFGFVPFLALVVMNLIYKSDVFIIKYFLTDAELGYYGLGVAVSEKIWILPESIGLVVLATAAQKNNNDSQQTALVCRITLFCALFLCIGLFFITPYLIPLLYSSDFLGAVLPLRILLPGIAFISVFMILHGDLTGRGNAMPTVVIFTAFLALNILLNFLWVPKLGIVGAAISSSLCYTGGALVLAGYYARTQNVSLRKLLLVDFEDFRTHFLGRFKLGRSCES